MRRNKRPHRRQAGEETVYTEDRARMQALVNICAGLMDRGIGQIDCQRVLDLLGAVPLPAAQSGPAPDTSGADPLTGCLPVTAKEPRPG